MKQILWCLLLLSSVAMSQNNAPVKPGTEYDGVAGTPYRLKDWADGTVHYRNGRIVNQFKLRFDCARNFLLLEFKGQTFAPQVASITSFVMYPKGLKVKDSMVFRKGFPVSGSYNEETFYEILLPAKAPLLYILSKTIVEQKDVIPTSAKKFFEDEDQFFMLVKGSLIHLVKYDQEKLAAQFPEQEAALLKFMNDEQLKMRSMEDFKKFAVKYNELVL